MPSRTDLAGSGTADGDTAARDPPDVAGEREVLGQGPGRRIDRVEAIRADDVQGRAVEEKVTAVSEEIRRREERA